MKRNIIFDSNTDLPVKWRFCYTIDNMILLYIKKELVEREKCIFSAVQYEFFIGCISDE